MTVNIGHFLNQKVVTLTSILCVFQA